MKKIKLLSAVMAGTLICSMTASVLVSAEDKYPTSDTSNDANGVILSNQAAWEDQAHAGGNYNANLDVTINGIKEKQKFNRPIDVQVVHDISTSMDYQCFADDHVNFTYFKDLSKDYDTARADEFKARIKQELAALAANGVTSVTQDTWLSAKDLDDGTGTMLGDDSYLVPRVPFAFDADGNITNSPSYENWWFVISNPINSKDTPRDPDGYGYFGINYHASVDAGGNYHSLNGYKNTDRASAIKSGCKSSTTTAYKALSHLADELYGANLSSHMSMEGFADNSKYVSGYTADLEEFNRFMVNSFMSGAGTTNYQAGLIAGKGNLEAHNDTADRKRYILFISDGRPNRHLDDNGNVVEGDGLDLYKAVADEAKAQGINMYTVGFCVDEDTNNDYLLPIASGAANAQYRDVDELDRMVDVYEYIQDKIIRETYVQSQVCVSISKYYTVDETKLPEGAALIESEETLSDGTTRTVQKVQYFVEEGDLNAEGFNTKRIPLILKEEYRGTNQYYPTNDEELNGANANYKFHDTMNNIKVKTPWLPVEIKTEEENPSNPPVKPAVPPTGTNKPGTSNPAIKNVKTVATGDSTENMTIYLVIAAAAAAVIGAACIVKYRKKQK